MRCYYTWKKETERAQQDNVFYHSFLRRIHYYFIGRFDSIFVSLVRWGRWLSFPLLLSPPPSILIHLPLSETLPVSCLAEKVHNHLEDHKLTTPQYQSLFYTETEKSIIVPLPLPKPNQNKGKIKQSPCSPFPPLSSQLLLLLLLSSIQHPTSAPSSNTSRKRRGKSRKQTN